MQSKPCLTQTDDRAFQILVGPTKSKYGNIWSYYACVTVRVCNSLPQHTFTMDLVSPCDIVRFNIYHYYSSLGTPTDLVVQEHFLLNLLSILGLS